jgi:hypothetical protein
MFQSRQWRIADYHTNQTLPNQTRADTGIVGTTGSQPQQQCCAITLTRRHDRSMCRGGPPPFGTALTDGTG